MTWSHIFLYFGKVIELYICLFGNASKMQGEFKFVIESDSQDFSSLLFLIVTLLDTESVWSSSLTVDSIKEHLSGLRIIKFLYNQFHKIEKSWFNEAIILFVFVRWVSSTTATIICRLILLKKWKNIIYENV